MATKIGTWLIAIGSCIVFFGLCALPAALGPNPDRTLLGFAMTIISAGMTLIAGALYIKSRYFGQRAAGRTESRSKRGQKTPCDQCGKNEPVIQCRVHKVQLCAACVGRHYDFRSCVYVPSSRSNARAAAYAKASGA